MEGHLYAIDMDGNEIPGTRRSLARCNSTDDYWKVRRALLASLGEGCTIRDSREEERHFGHRNARL